MRRIFILPVVFGLSALAVSFPGAAQAPAVQPPKTINITVHEGTSMAVSVSPDGKMLAIDLQGTHLCAAGIRRRGQAGDRPLQ